ncbi:twitch domain-containing radical SAM protein [Persicobacter sp. CCB-QB2]|uniref:twitch domain-containing radical SAM protein n=1 Tax=Persicobacter sp. CCB-QB2 TaxID=1561025 RepID=UPI0006A9B919|nr:twitch domain-containing radical SAM protein [Persicobacter sp. CCB-QB2]
MTASPISKLAHENAPLEAWLHTQAFCPLPWLHLHVFTDGKVTPCCSNFLHFGRVKEQSAEAIFQGKPANRFRKKLLADEQEKRCQSCYKMEAAQGDSLRTEAIKRYFEVFREKILHTNPEGKIKLKPESWDLRFSNQCNLRCRSCFHGNSSKWYEEAKSLNRTASDKKLIHAFEEKSWKDFTHGSLQTARDFYFAGGEPILIPEHWEILDFLLAQQKTDTLLRYNTNLSTITFKGKDIIEYWKKFPRLEIGISIDAVGKAGEYIRKDLRWSLFEKNIQRLILEVPNAKIKWEPTISLMNIHSWGKDHRYLIEHFNISPDAIKLNILHRPEIFSIQALTSCEKEQVHQKIEKLLSDLPFSKTTQDAYRALLSFMHAESKTALIPAFFQELERMDRMRQENWQESLPQLLPLFKAYEKEKQV